MTEDELNAEHAALLKEHAVLEVEHQALERRPYDAAAHERHSARLREHIDRLDRYMEARGYQKLSGQGKRYAP